MKYTTKKLFVFGCSYATGEELLMHRLGNLDDYRISTSDDPRKFFRRLANEGLIKEYEAIKQEQKKIAWPQQLADKLGYECINLSESGNSMDKILYQVYSEQKNISKEDIAIVSLTKATRNAVFNTEVESFQLPSLYWPVKNLLGVKDTGDLKPVIDEETDKALLKWFSDDRIAWDFVKNLQALESLNVKLVPTIKNNLTTSMPIIEELYEKSRQKFLTQLGLDDFSSNRLAWGHPDQIAHDKFAEHLYEILR